ncbi:MULTISPECIES: peptidoglycan-binding protein [unclassified Clostridioides]|uniref:peptidoglycan-binding domain-containing protein n=1 Tax=unclassified Clostridioides TaxID=2635829 RepID=UPI001D12AF14|nr:peptidoglycan-binding protein [Clostridioides sp. ES-S-0171-01]MCC0686672.1 peptidoglycan-binding protein [Clostridioides sp. ES-S-0056-01]MCC0713811.1 peptidoglycan-binding protein [Clostridioides sp. ES-S-0077-01]UDN55250.1 peptidoglycan-binding protein [Clostridioides sp. ES-S-0054-01]
MLKKVLALFCCLMLTFTNLAFAEKNENNAGGKKIINFEISGYTFKYKDAPDFAKKHYEQLCKELNIVPQQDDEVFISDKKSMLSENDMSMGTYSKNYGTYDPNRATITITGSSNYTISTRDLVGYGHITRGNNVHCVQIMLFDIGYDINIDSQFGPITYNAVKNFQRSYGLTSDGIVGYNTFDRMANLLDM